MSVYPWKEASLLSTRVDIAFSAFHAALERARAFLGQKPKERKTDFAANLFFARSLAELYCPAMKTRPLNRSFPRFDERCGRFCVSNEESSSRMEFHTFRKKSSKRIFAATIHARFLLPIVFTAVIENRVIKNSKIKVEIKKTLLIRFRSALNRNQ